MAFRVNVCLALLILTGRGLNSDKVDYNKYISLISDIHAYYKTSSVFFTLSNNDQSMQDLSMVHVLSRILSKQAVSTLIVNFVDINDRLVSYGNRIVRPLVVALVKSTSDIEEFNKNIQDRVKSYPIWLMIFYPDSDQQICEYCIRPVENILQLRFDTSMVVVCCNNPQLHEWWSVHKNRTEIDAFGLWTANERLNVLRSANRWNPKRSDVQGTRLRIVVVSSSSLIHDYGASIRGFLGGVYNDLRMVMNFTTSKIQRSREFGGYDRKKNIWSGAIGMLVRGEADLAIGDFAITRARLRAIEFTYPLMSSQNRLFIKNPESQDVKWTAYYKAFTSEIWEMIIFLIITTPLLLAVIKAKKSSKSFLSDGIDSYICVWGIFCQQGLSEFPAKTALRVAYFSIFILALVISAAYSASFISHLTLAPSSLPFTDIEGFVKDRSYKLIVLRNSSYYDLLSTSKDLLSGKMMEVLKPWPELPSRMSEAWEQVCKERVALFTTELDKTTSTIDCRVVAVGSGRVESLALGLPSGSQYTNVINHHIERFRSNGIISRFRRRYDKHLLGRVKRSYDAVEFYGIAPLLSVLAGGIVLSILILACERIYYSRNKHRGCSSGRTESRNPEIQGWPNLSKRNNPSSNNLLLNPRLQNSKVNTSFIGYYP